MRYIIDVDERIFFDSEIAECWRLPTYVKLIGDVTESSANKFREDLEVAELKAKQSKQNIIPIVIDSYGGMVYSLLSMVDAISNCKIPVATIIEGKAMSCGAILFSCGAEGHRYIGPNATVLIHDVSSWSSGKTQELSSSAEEANRLNKLVYRIMAKNCGHKDPDYFYNEVSKRRGADYYLTPEDCIKHKLANKIHIPSIEVNVKMSWKFE